MWWASDISYPRNILVIEITSNGDNLWEMIGEDALLANARMKLAVVAALIVGMLICLIPISYNQLFASGSLMSEMLACLVLIIPPPISLIVFTVFSGYFLSCYALIRSRRLIAIYAFLVGGISLLIPLILYKLGGEDMNISITLAMFGVIMMMISLLSGYIGWLRFHRPKTRIVKPLLAALLLICIFTSFTWSGGEIFLCGLGKSEDAWGCCGVFIGDHPRLSLLQECVTFNIPINKKTVILLIGNPRHTFGDKSREEWVYSVSGYAPDATIVFDYSGCIVEINYGYC